MRYTWATATHVGHVREGNEDAVMPEQDGSGAGPFLAAVADGMGGHVAGEVASGLAIAAATGAAADEDVAVGIRVEMGNEAVVDAMADDPGLEGMGTTLTLGLFGPKGTLDIGHVGDSRLYLYRDGDLRQLTRDHTWVAEMVAAGRLSEADAVNHPRRHLLTRVLGMAAPLEVDSDSVQLMAGDRIVICSDGLTTMIDDDRIAGLLDSAPTPSDAAWALVEAANAAGGYDNTTVAVVDVAS